MGQESRHGPAGSSGQGLRRLRSRCWLGCTSPGSLTGEEPSPKLPHVVGRMRFLVAIEFMKLTSSRPAMESGSLLH